MFLKEYHPKHGCDYKYIKNESRRVTVKCKESGGENEEGCKWRLHASRVGDTATYQIKTIKGEHICGRTYENRWASTKWLAKKYVEKIIDDYWEVKAMQNVVRRHLMLFHRCRYIGLRERLGRWLKENMEMNT
ncbi:hypothetical protein Vadar_006885 [Vaccinium darrowii]|uniref:Uncharacterized protein n=1 Tax=Vaccinium darrowii TaxID=229202 RepID=A0ACB7X7Z5_9ERIC|nr:hypothetical protein Vadar_006885 [Vaccinium darrowii]